ncbi:MAG: class I SAM-dependent methyltransferase [Actinomycetes bacterium]
MSQVAQRCAELMSAALGQELPVGLRAWDGSHAGPMDGPVIVLKDRKALRRMAWRPDELGLARAYVAGELDCEGDLYEGLQRLALMLDRTHQINHHVSAKERARLLALAVRLGAVGPEPAPPAEEARLDGDRHSKRRDSRAISHHYDVGNDFYRLVLGESMVYSCAYWREAPSATYTITEAERDKLDLVCRKLDLQPGQRLLDVGCGWGSMLIHAAGNYGIVGVGVTVSQEQAELARKRVADAGLSDQIEIRLQDYRDVHDGPYDAISSIGMAEHVGEAPYLDYARGLFELLKPGGRLLNHQIARRPGPSHDGPTFINSYVFPDGELSPLGSTVSWIEEAGFEVRDVQALREHYALTLRAWVSNLDEHWDEALKLVSPGRARVWKLYMTASALAFENNRIGVNQVLAVKADPNGASGVPLVREEWMGFRQRPHALAS